MKEALEKLLGPSWRTTLAGLVSGICAFISFYPESIEPLPDYWERFKWDVKVQTWQILKILLKF